jgi:hypothetical protein
LKNKGNDDDGHRVEGEEVHVYMKTLSMNNNNRMNTNDNKKNRQYLEPNRILRCFENNARVHRLPMAIKRLLWQLRPSMMNGSEIMMNYKFGGSI